MHLWRCQVRDCVFVQIILHIKTQWFLLISWLVGIIFKSRQVDPLDCRTVTLSSAQTKIVANDNILSFVLSQNLIKTFMLCKEMKEQQRLVARGFGQPTDPVLNNMT